MLSKGTTEREEEQDKGYKEREREREKEIWKSETIIKIT